ncbi:MAG TPA: ABC transporter ATP-binding protein [Polyangia bacterium]|nr:ABC transporter ATP-binding protein [Polyangia bacterium]
MQDQLKHRELGRAESREIAIQIRRLNLKFGGRSGAPPIRVLEDVDLEVKRGEFVCIVGPSGCGKSTLLNVIAGFVRPGDGEVRVEGEPVTGPDRRRLLVFQESGVFPWSTVEENIRFGLDGKSKAEQNEIIRHYVAMVGLLGFERSYPRELSGGMRQRLEIARALAANPDIIYMDEPFGALDYLTRLRMRADLVRIWQAERKTILLVTHDIEEAVQLADRVFVMSARPSRVKVTVNVDLPRPRDIDAPEYLALRDLVLSNIEWGGLGASPAADPQDLPGPNRKSTVEFPEYGEDQSVHAARVSRNHQ